MKVIFQVNDRPILSAVVAADGSEVTQWQYDHFRMAKTAFPALDHPTLGALLRVLRAYAGVSGNVGLAELAAQTGGRIDYIEFKQNLNIVFAMDAED